MALVTGAGTGIGKGMTIALALNGAKVIITGRRFEVIEATALEINSACAVNGQGGEVIAIQGDVATKAGVEKLYEAVSKVVDKVRHLSLLPIFLPSESQGLIESRWICSSTMLAFRPTGKSTATWYVPSALCSFR